MQKRGEKNRGKADGNISRTGGFFRRHYPLEENDCTVNAVPAPTAEGVFGEYGETRTGRSL